MPLTGAEKVTYITEDRYFANTVSVMSHHAYFKEKAKERYSYHQNRKRDVVERLLTGSLHLKEILSK
jgi:hypothetical protein